jgi:hypothetical protein
MTKPLKSCVRCKKTNRGGLSQGYCRRCAKVRRGRIQIEAIQKIFRAKGSFNERVFNQIILDLSRMEVKPRDVRLLRGAAEVLSHERFTEPRSWAEVRVISGRLRIRYAFEYRLSCPVIRMAEALQKEGKIATDQRFSKRYEMVIGCFEPKTRKVVEAYLSEEASSSLFYTWSVARYLRHFQSSLNGGSLLRPDVTRARSYFDPVATRSLSTSAETLVLLERFYVWCIREGHSSQNPFAGWCPEQLRRICPKCGQTFCFRRHDLNCKNCSIQPSTETQLSRVAKSFRTPSPYNQHLFDLYLKQRQGLLVMSYHVRLAQGFAEFLESQPIPAIRSWKQLAKLSEEFSSRQKRALQGGCPFIMVGQMLEQLGVLPIRQLDREVMLENIYQRCDSESSRLLRRYSDHLTRMNCATRGRYGQVRTVFELQLWLTQSKSALMQNFTGSGPPDFKC